MQAALLGSSSSAVPCRKQLPCSLPQPVSRYLRSLIGPSHSMASIVGVSLHMNKSQAICLSHEGTIAIEVNADSAVASGQP